MSIVARIEVPFVEYPQGTDEKPTTYLVPPPPALTKQVATVPSTLVRGRLRGARYC
jgi:hypothetical protein